MNGAVIVVVFIAIALIAVGAAIIGYRLNKKRQAAFAAWAAQRGFTYATEDGRYANLPWGAPFGVGSRRRALDVVSGTTSGRPALCFTLRYTTTSGSGQNRRSQTHYYSVYSLGLLAELPELRVGPEGFFSSLARMVGVHDIEFESEDFNRAYKVKSGNRKFAYDVVNPQLMQFLLAGDGPGFAVVGSNLFWTNRGRLLPENIDGTLGYLSAIVEHIPDFVWRG